MEFNEAKYLAFVVSLCYMLCVHSLLLFVIARAIDTQRMFTSLLWSENLKHFHFGVTTIKLFTLSQSLSFHICWYFLSGWFIDRRMIVKFVVFRDVFFHGHEYALVSLRIFRIRLAAKRLKYHKELIFQLSWYWPSKKWQQQ